MEGEAICEHCHKSVAYRVITAITCVTWRPNMTVCQVMMDCLTAMHQDNTQPIKHVLTTWRNNNLKTKKILTTKTQKKSCLFLRFWLIQGMRVVVVFSFMVFPPLIFCFRWLIIPQNNQICMLLMFSFGNKNQQITENSYLVLINQKPCIQFTSYFSSRCNKLWGWFFYHQHAC